jgi:DNA-binding NarL/FixJ family response regulator
MTNVYIADSQLDERSAFRLMLTDLKMTIVGEASNWATLISQVATSNPDVVLVDWNLISQGSGMTMSELRAICPVTSVIVLISQWDAGEQAALSSGADIFISKAGSTRQVAERLMAAADSVRFKRLLGMV